MRGGTRQCALCLRGGDWSPHPVLPSLTRRGITVLVDIDGLSLRHLWGPWISLLVNVIDLCQANYPECLKTLLITRVPSTFPLICTILRSLLDRISHSKIAVFTENELAGLAQFIPSDQIPAFLGGPSQSGVDLKLDNCQVPMENYCNGTLIVDDDKGNTMETHRGNKLWSTSLYRSIYVVKDNPHEIEFQANSCDVIHWDFDVLKGDVLFSIFLVKEEDSQFVCPKPRKYSFVGISSGMSPRRLLRHSHKLDPVIPVLEYHFGNSVQDSLKVAVKGLYVLQWSASANFLQSKSKFMYYAQLFTREDIRSDCFQYS
ncbi:SEC14-like protein 1 [Octopus sinensis]|uniref:SEC14-like protein 1 n=1 Tax=Octopus sinensis TaxID=2607531 RepID=A0A6P7TXS5_9MOLL|nr:SEC14-like protein 1 [Octopus sinensis]